MKKFLLLIPFLFLTLPGFSQTVTDTSYVILPSELARLVIKDLIEGDAAKAEVTILRKKIDLNEQKLIGSDAIIANLNKQIDNLKTVESSRKEQIGLYEDLSTRLEKDLKVQKTKTKIYQSTTGIGLVVVGLLSLGVL